MIKMIRNLLSFFSNKCLLKGDKLTVPGPGTRSNELGYEMNGCTLSLKRTLTSRAVAVVGGAPVCSVWSSRFNRGGRGNPVGSQITETREKITNQFVPGLFQTWTLTDTEYRQVWRTLPTRLH